MRGPLVYCFEGVDNDTDVISLALDDNASIKVGEYDEVTLGGIVKLSVSANRILPSEDLYSYTCPEMISAEAEAVPYYSWGNRGINQMRVWMPRL